MACHEVADDVAAVDTLVTRDRWGDRFVGCPQAAWVFQGDQWPVDDWPRVDHAAVARRQDRAIGPARDVDPAVARSVGRERWDEGADELVGLG
ncbi:hypothetical protein AOZ06_44655 [Kibdelosporangium phytohabitans]|uniref:Uncharacterized protein n=1 Tax=Kibdelosporangium phytohabitans TaxID=860235 RepID=A0A0N7F521_9PSEU|nr:hypothetical protein AOZ06_44655 [Kibdelosporangium phytohabitans]